MSNIQWVVVRVVINAFVESETKLNLLSEIGSIFFQILQFYLHPMTDGVCIELQISLQCFSSKASACMSLSFLHELPRCFKSLFRKVSLKDSMKNQFTTWTRVESYNANQVL